MNNKLKIAIEIVAVALLIIVIVNIVKNNLNKSEEQVAVEIQYDEVSNEYYIEDEETGEVIQTASCEDELRIYTIDPDYDPQNPDEPSEEEYYEDIEIEE